MKKIPVQIKIGSLMLLAVVILSAAGYLSYRNLSSIVSSIKVDQKPDLRLITIREISMDLERAQNSIRIYTLTKDTLDLQPYYSVISDIDGKVGRLKEECMNDTLLPDQIDTISNLIGENIIIWNKLLNLNNNQNVAGYINQLSSRLSIEAENAKKKKGVFKRIFGNDNESQDKELAIINDLQTFKQTDSIARRRLIARESQLAVTGSEIKERFYDLISKIENEISVMVEAKAKAADILARKTYSWLALFSLSGTLLAIAVMFIIIRFVRKTRLYQIALENSGEEARKLARTREMFVANMSHEIRTPVTAISGFTEQLLQEPADENTARSLRVIKSSSDHLKNIINDILDFSKLQNEKQVMEQVNFNIRQLLEEVYSLFEKQALRNNTMLSYSLSPDTPPVLLGDPYRLKQIIINLVSNSVKFTQNGKVHFSVKSNSLTQNKLELLMEFTDTGIGIEESKLAFIFEDFAQEETSTSRKYGGTGLGLSIVKKLVDLHGGTIVCVSRKNHGTSITCRLPYLEGDEKLIKPEPEPSLNIPPVISNLKILIVDDEEYNRLLFKTILTRWKVKFREAADGSEALAILKSDRFDLVFMDDRMPGIDGITATRTIRKEMNISGTEMPVICISAVDGSDAKQKYIDAGMNEFLPKPFTEMTLLNTILSVLKTLPKKRNEEHAIPVKNKPEISVKMNLDNLYHISGDDEHFVKQMLISFAESTQNGLAMMNEELTKGNLKQVADLAHKLLPPARHIGATDLCGYLGTIEDSVNNNSNGESVKNIIKQAMKEFEAVNELIKERIAKIE